MLKEVLVLEDVGNVGWYDGRGVGDKVGGSIGVVVRSGDGINKDVGDWVVSSDGE